ncbi:772_t:CDS:2, partial [Scutellospora calospora]
VNELASTIISTTSYKDNREVVNAELIDNSKDIEEKKEERNSEEPIQEDNIAEEVRMEKGNSFLMALNTVSTW